MNKESFLQTTILALILTCLGSVLLYGSSYVVGGILTADSAPAPTTARLTLVKKVVDNKNANLADWVLNAVGPTPISGSSGSASVTNKVVTIGKYYLTETTDPFTNLFYHRGGWVCNGNDASIDYDKGMEYIELNPGNIVTCIIENTYDPPKLIIKKVSYGKSGDFDFDIQGVGVVSSESATLTTEGTQSPFIGYYYSRLIADGQYNILELVPAGVTVTGSPCAVEIVQGETKVCTFINEEII